MASDSEDDDYSEYGTSLDPLDEDAMPRKKPFSLADQVARDNQGRRRFHGAFTGGFSAGFFNSVGSVEGWTPSAFKSSRSDRADSRAQKVEDYMDDEDIGEFGIAPKVLRATQDFNDVNKKRRREQQHVVNGPIPGEPVLRELLQPSRETVGIKLLRCMGWKSGQGVGPRLTKAEKRRSKQEHVKTNARVYGCSLNDDSLSDASESSEYEYSDQLTFAPDDYEAFLCKAKDNVFGIGYSGLDKRPILSAHISLFEPPSLVLNEKSKKVLISGQAFGVGALEEEDDDIYAREDMSQYDFSLDTAPSISTKRKPVRPISSGNFAEEVLDSFTLASKPSLLKKYFPPPILPQGYQPVHIIRKSRFELVVDSMEVSAKKRGLQRHTMTAADRTALLTQPVSALTSEPHYSKEEFKILADEALKITENLLESSSDILSQFRPFAGHPDKQKRYEQYLCLLNVGQKDRLTHLQPLSMTEWEKERERSEFEQAARLFRPLTGIMSDRFVSASQPDDTTNPLAVVERLVDGNSEKRTAAKMKMFGSLTRDRDVWQPCSLLCKRFNIPEPVVGDVASKTVEKRKSRFSVFDYLDASVHNMPKLDAGPPEDSNVTIHKVADEQLAVTAQDSAVPETLEVKTETEAVPGKETILDSVTPAEDQMQFSNGNSDRELTFCDPPEKIDLYKAIFLSSSEESESEEEETTEKDKITDDQVALAPLADISSTHLTGKPHASEIPLPPATEVNELRNMSPPRGIFANLDLDAINARKQTKTSIGANSVKEGVLDIEPRADALKKVISNNLPEKGTSHETSPNIDGKMYGPSLPATPLVPAPPSTSTGRNFLSSIISPRKWVEWVEKPKKSSHKSKHEKKSHKKSSKHKKHKSKKHKKHKRL